MSHSDLNGGGDKLRYANNKDLQTSDLMYKSAKQTNRQKKTVKENMPGHPLLVIGLISESRHSHVPTNT